MTTPNSPDGNEDYVDARSAMQAAEEGFANQNEVTAFLQYLKHNCIQDIYLSVHPAITFALAPRLLYT